MQVGAFDDLEPPGASGGYRTRHFRTLITCVGEYLFDERKAPAHATQQIARSIAILNIGGQNAHAEQQAKRIDEDVALTTRDFLACVEALRINRGAPF